MTTAHLILRAQMLMQQGKHALAEEQLRLSLAQDSGDATAHALLALCLSDRKAWDAATDEARQAIVAAPDNAFTHYALAQVMRSRNRMIEARHAINEALRLEPTDADYFAVLAGIEAAEQLWHACLKAAETGLAHDAEHAHCSNFRAIALTKLGRRDEAGQTIQEELRRNPENAFSHANEGWRQLHARQPVQAMEHFREALRLEPNFEWARQGIIEAMKARFFIYRWMLSFFLWIGRFPPKVQLALMIGIPVGQRVLQSVLDSVPALKPLSLPLIIGYLTFVWMTWCSSALFELVLMTSRFGRLALNRSEKIRASLVGACVAGGVAMMGISFWLSVRRPGFWEIAVYSAVLLPGLAIPVIMATLARNRQHRRLAVAWTAAVACVCIWANVKMLQYIPLLDRYEAQHMAAVEQNPEVVIADSDELRKSADLVKQHSSSTMAVCSNATLMIIVSTWLGLFLSRVPERR